MTRFERQLVSQNILDRMYAAEQRIENVIIQRELDFSKSKVTIKGRNVEGLRINMELLFSSNDGRSWSQTLVKPHGNRAYLVRFKLDQRHGYPRLHGFRTQWKKPSSWTWIDGLPATLYDTASSNPMLITRPVMAPASPGSATFSVTLHTMYR